MLRAYGLAFGFTSKPDLVNKIHHIIVIRRFQDHFFEIVGFLDTVKQERDPAMRTIDSFLKPYIQAILTKVFPAVGTHNHLALLKIEAYQALEIFRVLLNQK